MVKKLEITAEILEKILKSVNDGLKNNPDIIIDNKKLIENISKLTNVSYDDAVKIFLDAIEEE